ncbi:hypothetical protein ACFXPX_32735 [Kitasatospora sp. NPDC059146]|uniref:hypothetical protein n=1 Tax=unclassified Kitasatospora TaxID=2633591 RepID=UPI0036874F1F
MSAQHDPYSALTDEAEFYDLPGESLEKILPPFEAGLLMAAGRALAVLTYRDAAAHGDTPFDRHAPGADGTVLALLPPACDTQGRAFRAGAARALWDLADDIAGGLAPVPRCGAESWALEVMLEAAPALFAASDDELGALGVAVPQAAEERSYRQPYWEEAWQLVVDDAKYSIPEARCPADGEDAEEEEVPEPEGGWDAPIYWFSPYGIAHPRGADRGHPAWAQDHLDGGLLLAPAPLTVKRAAELLRLGEAKLRPEESEKEDERRRYFDPEADCVLTPLGARLLAAAADQLAEMGWEDLFEHGDRVYERSEDEDDWLTNESFLACLPAVCDGHGAAWRMAMVQAVENLRDDLRAGRAPSATCTAEELAFHLIVGQARELFDYLDDEDYAADYGLPTADQISIRHRAFDLYLETYLQDWDVLMHFDEDLQHVAADPDHPASQQLGTGDLRPRAWFVPFNNVRPRPPRPLSPEILERLAAADPTAFFTSTDISAAAEADLDAGLPDGLRQEFETFVGLAQHRFFDEPCAIAMAASLERLLTAFFSTPSVVPGRIWPINSRATARTAGWLLVDHNFQLRGQTKTWRLNSDRTDQDARTWATDLLLDCANYILANYRRHPAALLGDPESPPPPPLDPDLPELLEQRLSTLSRDYTAAGTLRHRIDRLSLTPQQLAQAALLPEPLVASWLNGDAAPSPSQLMRCAPVLQVSEDVLLDALAGKRATAYWPLPQPPADRLGRPGAPTDI